MGLRSRHGASSLFWFLRTSSAASTVSGIDGLTVSVAAMSATLGVASQSASATSTALRRISIRSSSRWLNADAGIGEQKPPAVARKFHQDDLADNPAGSKAQLVMKHGFHQRRSGDLALHEGLCLAVLDQSDR